MNCLAFEFRGPDRDTHECVKPWKHAGDHEFVKVEEVRIRNTQFNADTIAAFEKRINDEDPRYHYSANAIRAALFKFVSRQIDLLIEDLGWHWDHHHGWECLGEPDIDLGEQPDKEAEVEL